MSTTDHKQNDFLNLSAKEAGNQALEPAVSWAGAEYGRVTQIATALSMATGSTVSRQMVSRWLNQDPAKRVPIGSLGMGLMLLHVVGVLQHDPFPNPPSFKREMDPLTVALFRPTTTAVKKKKTTNAK